MADKKIEKFIKKLERQLFTQCYLIKTLDMDENGNIMCPSHPDISNNCYVDLEQGYFECVTCGMRGNLILLLMLVENASFKEIVLALARETQIEIPPIIPGLKPSRYDK